MNLALIVLATCICQPPAAAAPPAAPIPGGARLDPVDILVIAPHSDDEAIGCTGVMLRAIAQGERVGVVVVTAGDGGPKIAAAMAKKPVDALVPQDFVDTAALRQRHTLEAMPTLGVRA